jgi:hypothetical protein
VTTTLRSLHGIVFAAILALSLIATTQDAIAKSTGTNTNAMPALFDQDFQDFVGNATKYLHRPVGRFGVSWE